MKLTPWLTALLLGVTAVGVIEIRYQAERAALRAEVARLKGKLGDAEDRAVSRESDVAKIERERREWTRGIATLADLEARLLDQRAELAILESDRVVAEDRAARAIEDLKRQVRSFTEIEADVAALDRRRQRLMGQVRVVEGHLQQAELGAAERQKRAEALDREIAGLAIRRETLEAKLALTERAMAANALNAMVETAALTDTPARPAPAPVTAAAVPEPAAVLDDVPEREGDVREGDERNGGGRGLYRFSRLSAQPETAAPAETIDEDVQAENWAENQYLMGLTLISNAERRSGTRELSDAVLAFKAVLGEWPKERDRMRWAIARSDLGYALALLGKRQGDAALLEDAAAACRDALDEFERDETPILWAAAKHHLGISLGGLAGLRGDPGLWQESITSLEEAIAAFKGAGALDDARKVEARLREAYAGLPDDHLEVEQ